jgi:hypothetical protein
MTKKTPPVRPVLRVVENPDLCLGRWWEGLPWEFRRESCREMLLVSDRMWEAGRKTCTFGAGPRARTYVAQPTPGDIAATWDEMEEICGHPFDICMVRGLEDMHQHSGRFDDGAGAAALIAVGSEREIRFRHREDGHEWSTVPSNGSILCMDAGLSLDWSLSIPPDKHANGPYINLFFQDLDHA